MDCNYTETQSFQHFLIRWLKNESDLFKRKVKLYRFLNSKGYEADLIKDVVEEIGKVG